MAEAPLNRMTLTEATTGTVGVPGATVVLWQNIIGTTHYEPDFDALLASSVRIVIAAGAESYGEMDVFAATLRQVLEEG